MDAATHERGSKTSDFGCPNPLEYGTDNKCGDVSGSPADTGCKQGSKTCLYFHRGFQGEDLIDITKKAKKAGAGALVWSLVDSRYNTINPGNKANKIWWALNNIHHPLLTHDSISDSPI